MLLSLVVVVVVWNMCAALWLAGCHRMCAGRVRDVCVCWRIPTPPPPCSADMLCELREQVVATGASIRIISPRGPDLDSALASACIGPLFPDVFESGAHQGAYQGAYQVGAPAAPCSAGGAEDRKPLWHPAVSTLTGQDVRDRVAWYGCHRGPLETVLPRPSLTLLRRYGLYAFQPPRGGCGHPREVRGRLCEWDQSCDVLLLPYC